MGSMVFSLLRTKLLSVRKGASHPNLCSYQKSEGKRKQIMFFHTWNMFTATFGLTSCCKWVLFSALERFFNKWLFISWFVANFGRPCWLVIKILQFTLKRKLIVGVVLKNPISNYKRFTRCAWMASALGLHTIGLPTLYYCSHTFHDRIFTYITYSILLHEKLLQFDWLRTVVFQLNLNSRT